MKYVKLPGRRSCMGKVKKVPFEDILNRLLNDDDFAKKFPKGAAMLRLLLETTYTAGYMDGQVTIVEKGEELSSGWQSLTGGATWQEVFEQIEDSDVPVPDMFVRFCDGENIDQMLEDTFNTNSSRLKDWFSTDDDSDAE